MKSIGISGPIFIPQLKRHLFPGQETEITGMGGTPVNHQIEALLKAGYIVSVYSLTPELEEGQSVELKGRNLSIYIGPYRRKARHRCVDLFRQERVYIKDAILSVKPDIIHAHWQYEWAWGAIDTGIPTLVTCHDSPLKILKVQTNLYRLIRLLMAKIVLYKAKHISAVSPHTAAGLKFLTKKYITIIPNFESEDVFKLYNKKKTQNKDLKIAMVNNGFFGLKNVRAGISAFVKYQMKSPGSKLFLYGNGHGIDQDAHQWCNEKGYYRNIFFKGEMNFNDLIKDFSMADVLLHTSFEESCPMVVIEAFAFGIPVIGGLNSGGIPWMIEEGCGCLVDVQDTDSIVDGLMHLSQPEILSNYSANARNLALKRFSTNAVMKQYHECYEKILK